MVSFAIGTGYSVDLSLFGELVTDATTGAVVRHIPFNIFSVGLGMGIGSFLKSKSRDKWDAEQGNTSPDGGYLSRLNPISLNG